MSGAFNGVQAIIREKYQHALYLDCASHSLNLAICRLKVEYQKSEIV